MRRPQCNIVPKTLMYRGGTSNYVAGADKKTIKRQKTANVYV